LLLLATKTHDGSLPYHCRPCSTIVHLLRHLQAAGRPDVATLAPGKLPPQSTPAPWLQCLPYLEAWNLLAKKVVSSIHWRPCAPHACQRHTCQHMPGTYHCCFHKHARANLEPSSARAHTYISLDYRAMNGLGRQDCGPSGVTQR
jgi:hypothetical protein